MPTKSKITSYIASHRSSPASAKLDNATTYEWFDPKLKDEVYNPDPERMIGTVLSRLMTYPGQALPREYNNFLLHVIESYRVIKQDILRAQAHLEAESEEHETITNEFGRVGRSWGAERDRLIAEVKRLGLVIAEGKKEMTALLGARQANEAPVILPTIASKQKVKGAIQEGPAKTDSQENMSESLRAERRVSQSYGMTALSRTLEVDGHSAELPFGTPPSRDPRTGFANVHDSPLRGGKSNPASRHTTPSKNSTLDWSDEDMSSSGGDRLPGEANNAKETLNAANDMDFLLQVTKWLADKRGVEPTEIFPEVAELLLGKEEGKSLPDTPNSIRFRQEKPLPNLPGSADDSENEYTLISPLAERRPTRGEHSTNPSPTGRPRTVENPSPIDVRRFSFMPGDDTAPSALSHWSADHRFPGSRSDLKDKHGTLMMDTNTGSPPLRRTVISRIPLESRPGSVDTNTTMAKISKIPSPTTDYSIASPRRDDSGSNKSVVTAIRDNSGRSTGTSRRDSPGSLAESDSLADPVRRLRPGSAGLTAVKAAADGRISPVETTKDAKTVPGRQSPKAGSERSNKLGRKHSDYSAAGGVLQKDGKRRDTIVSPEVEKKARKGSTTGM
ncbi:MAG: hypothetical protein M1812_000082 [Candelaria pacifica]|nr:MAG: hypothetical protein M1812_000082 [Candelaria pacifica]